MSEESMSGLGGNKPRWAENYGDHCGHCGHWHSAGRGDFEPVCCWCDTTHPSAVDSATKTGDQ